MISPCRRSESSVAKVISSHLIGYTSINENTERLMVPAHGDREERYLLSDQIHGK